MALPWWWWWWRWWCSVVWVSLSLATNSTKNNTKNLRPWFHSWKRGIFNFARKLFNCDREHLSFPEKDETKSLICVVVVVVGIVVVGGVFKLVWTNFGKTWEKQKISLQQKLPWRSDPPVQTDRQGLRSQHSTDLTHRNKCRLNMSKLKKQQRPLALKNIHTSFSPRLCFYVTNKGQKTRASEI